MKRFLHRSASGADRDKADILTASFIALSFGGYQVFSFLSIALNLGEANTRTVSVPYRIAMLGFSALLLGRAVMRRTTLFTTKIHMLLLCVWVMLTVRLWYETALNADTLAHSPSDYWTYWGGIGIASVCGFAQRISAKTTKVAIGFIWALSFIACAVGIFYTGSQLHTVEDRLWVNPMLNPITYSASGAMLILLSAYFALQTKRVVVGVLFGIATIPGFLIMEATASKGPLLGFLLGVALLCWYGARTGAGWRVLVGTAIILGVLPFVTSYLVFSGSNLVTRLFEASDNYRYGEVDRFLLWREALGNVRQHPIVGSGIELENGMYPHNVLLEAFMETGCVGGAVFFLLYFTMVRKVLRISETRGIAGISLIAIQYLAGSLFSGGLYFFPEFWALGLLIAAVMAAKEPVAPPTVRGHSFMGRKLRHQPAGA
jgi:O-antigen ligase